MPVLQTTIDDADVGRGGGEYFKVTSQKQRIAIIPYFVTKQELVISEEMKAKAADDAKVAAAIDHTMKFIQLLQEGAEAEPPRVKPMTWNGIEGFRYCRMDSAYAHYDETVKYYLCKADEYKALNREAECCLKGKSDAMAAGKPEQGDAQRLYAFIVLVYNTDAEGNILKIAPEARRKLDDQHKLDFKFEFRTWAINDSKMKGLKAFKNKFPPISCDYEVSEQMQGQSKRVIFSPCNGTALWLSRGPVLEQEVLDAVDPMWEKISRTIGRDMTIAEIDTLCGKAPAGNKPKTTEKSFAGLIG